MLLSASSQSISSELEERFKSKSGINPELEENKAIQQLWKNYEHELHKRRRTYRKDI